MQGWTSSVLVAPLLRASSSRAGPWRTACDDAASPPYVSQPSLPAPIPLQRHLRPRGWMPLQRELIQCSTTGVTTTSKTAALFLPFVSGGRRPDPAIPAQIRCSCNRIRPLSDSHLGLGPGVAAGPSCGPVVVDWDGAYGWPWRLEWPVRASHYCGRVRQRLRVVWRRPVTLSISAWCLAGARLPLSRPSPVTAPWGVAAAGKLLIPRHDVTCRCAPPTFVGESSNSSARCGGGWQALRPPSV